MAAAPYNIILAGQYGVGKTSLFTYLSTGKTTSVRGWDKWEHVISLEEETVQVVLWDTADMEKNSINSMTKSYFIECVGVMMVYKKGDLGSLIKLDAWWTRANESQFCRSLVFSLWCNDIDRSEDETEVSEEHVRQYAAKWKVPCDLVFNIDPGEDDRESVTVKYKKLVKAVREKSQGTALLRSTTAGRVRLPDVTRRANIQEKPKKTCSSPCNR